jgi:LPS-assembly lipoprotein
MLIRGAILALLTITVTACGFSLRGSAALSGNLPELQLNLQQPNSEVARLLRRALEDANVVLHDLDDENPSAAVPVLSVGAEQLVVQPITVTPRARAAQYDIRISLPVNLSNGETTLLGPEQLTIQQTYYENTGNIAGTQEEIEVIQDEMRRGLVTQLLRRLEAITG